MAKYWQVAMSKALSNFGNSALKLRFLPWKDIPQILADLSLVGIVKFWSVVALTPVSKSGELSKLMQYQLFQCLQTFNDSDEVEAIAMSSDGKTLISGS